jgi:hypothetical protein
MKIIAQIVTSGCLLAFSAGHALADDPVSGTLVAINAQASYVPVGFDDNDDVVVVLDGNLPDSCYKLSHTEILKDAATNKITVIQYARRYPGICLESLVPFSSESNLGVMPVGLFSVASPGALQEKLQVTEATSAGPDEFLYAPVDSTKVSFDETTGTYRGILEGRFTNTCMRIKEVTVINSGKTLEVLPKMELVDAPNGCQTTEVPFSWTVDLPKEISKGRHLMHVRSLNGKAVNKMFSVY